MTGNYHLLTHISNKLPFYLLLLGLIFCNSVSSPAVLFQRKFCSVSHWGSYYAIILPDISCCVAKAALDGWPLRPAVVEGMCRERPRHYNQTLALTGVEPRQGTALLSFQTTLLLHGTIWTTHQGRVLREKNQNKCLQISAVCMQTVLSCTSCLDITVKGGMTGYWQDTENHLGAE